MIGAFTYLRQIEESEPAVRIIEWVPSEAPDRDAKLTVVRHYADHFDAYWEPGYCGCDDCHPIVGHGMSEQKAVENYWEQWSSR